MNPDPDPDVDFMFVLVFWSSVMVVEVCPPSDLHTYIPGTCIYQVGCITWMTIRDSAMS